MKQSLALAWFLVGLLVAPSQARAGEDPRDEQPGPSSDAPSAPLLADSPEPAAEEAVVPPDAQHERHRLFPLGGRAAIARGYRIPEPWGLSALMVWNDTHYVSRDLSVALRKGAAPPEDAELLELPSVTTSRLEGDTRMFGLKGDLWLFPGVDLFASVGKVTGTNNIDVDIDLDQLGLFPLCRPIKPCGVAHLPIAATIDNTTLTLGTVLVYGNQDWFVLGSIAKTVSVSSKERSDVTSTNLALRGGARFQLAEDTYFEPYVGTNYFDLEATVRGVVASGPLFEDGESLNLRYEVDMSVADPWAAVGGFNVELSRHLSLQAELQIAARSTRVVTSAGVRF